MLFSSEATIDTFPDAASIKLLILALLALIVFGLVLFPYLRWLALFRKTPSMKKVRTYTFTSEGVNCVTDDARYDCNWSVFTRIHESRRGFIFLLGAQGIHVPRRYFSSHDDVLSLRQIIRDNFKGKTHLMRG